ncbi:MAG: hypothetical protein ACLS7U_05465 [Enterocloster sp.]
MKHRKIGLFELVLFSLIIIEELSKIYIFSNSEIYSLFANYIQLPLYVALLHYILKKSYTNRQLLIFAIIGVLLLYGYIKSGQAAYFRAFLLIIAAKNISFKKIVRICRYAITSTFLFTVLLWICRISDGGIGRRGKLSFGYGHPNITAQTVMIIMLLYLAERGNNAKTKDYILFETIAVAVMLLTGSKTAMIIIALTPITISFFKWYLAKKKLMIGNLIIECSQISIIVFTWLSAKMLPYSYLLKKLDLLLTNRLFLNYYQFNKYSLSLFGKNVSLYETGQVYNEIQNFWATITCDCTYTISLIIMGIIPTMLFAIAYIYLVKKAIASKDYIVIAIAVMLAMYAFCESQLVEIYNNFVFFYICAKNNKRMEKLQ